MTLKYLLLLFASDDLISLDDFVLTTEAHPLRRRLQGNDIRKYGNYIKEELEVNASAMLESILSIGTLEAMSEILVTTRKQVLRGYRNPPTYETGCNLYLCNPIQRQGQTRCASAPQPRYSLLLMPEELHILALSLR